MIGNPGRGKTRLSVALGLNACYAGYRVLFKNAATISTELCETRDNYHPGKLERTLESTDLLILDQLSYPSFNRYQSELLFKVISDRGEKAVRLLPQICLFPDGLNCLKTQLWLQHLLTD